MGDLSGDELRQLKWTIEILSAQVRDLDARIGSLTIPATAQRASVWNANEPILLRYWLRWLLIPGYHKEISDLLTPFFVQQIQGLPRVNKREVVFRRRSGSPLHPLSLHLPVDLSERGGIYLAAVAPIYSPHANGNGIERVGTFKVKPSVTAKIEQGDIFASGHGRTREVLWLRFPSPLAIDKDARIVLQSKTPLVDFLTMEFGGKRYCCPLELGHADRFGKYA